MEEKLEKILMGQEEMRKEIMGVKQNMSIIQQNMSIIQQNMYVMQQDMGTMKQEINTIKQEIIRLDDKIDKKIEGVLNAIFRMENHIAEAEEKNRIEHQQFIRKQMC